MKKIVCFSQRWSSTVLLVLLPVLSLLAQHPSITIQVMDADHCSALPRAHIIVDGMSTVVADADGCARFSVPRLPIKAKVSYVGFLSTDVILTAEQRHYVVSLHSDVYSLDSLHVTARRNTAQGMRNTEKISTEDLSRRQDATLASVLATQAGVRVMSTSAVIEKPIIEGMYGSRIAIIENQSKLQGQQWGDDHAPEMSLPAYAQVSVEKGAAGVRYGANAIGGIVMVNTDIDPLKHGTTGSLNTSYATNGRRLGADGYVETSLTKLSHFRFRVAAKHYSSGDYSTAHYMLNNTGTRLTDLRTDWGWKWSSKWTWQQHLSYYDATLGIFGGSHIGSVEDLLTRFALGRPGEEEIAPYSRSVAAPKQHIGHFTSNSLLQWVASDNDLLQWRLVYQRDHRQEFEPRVADNTRRPTFSFVLQTLAMQVAWKHQYNARANSEVGLSTTFAQNTTDEDTKAVPIIPNYVANNAALYFIHKQQFASRWTGEAGLRVEYQDASASGFNSRGKAYGGTRHYLSLSGSVGTRWNVTPHTYLLSHLGLAYRAPEMNELYARGVHHGDAVYQVGDENLKTEKAYKWTFGLHTEKGTLSLQANVFAHYIMDFIYDTPHYTTDAQGNRVPEVAELLSGAFPMYYYTQSNGVFAGAELILGWQIAPWLHYQVGGEWMRARNVEEHLYFANIPSDRYQQQLSFQKTWAGYKVEASVNHQFVDRQRHFSVETDLLPTTPLAYHLMGAQLSVEKRVGKLSLQWYANVDNALNTLYKDYNNRLRYYAHDRGRTIQMGLRCRF